MHQACSCTVLVLQGLSPSAGLIIRLERSTAVWQHRMQTNWEPLETPASCFPLPGKSLSLPLAWMQLVNSFPADGNRGAGLLAALEDPCKVLHAFQVAATVLLLTQSPRCFAGSDLAAAYLSNALQ